MGHQRGVVDPRHLMRRAIIGSSARGSEAPDEEGNHGVIREVLRGSSEGPQRSQKVIKGHQRRSHLLVEEHHGQVVVAAHKLANATPHLGVLVVQSLDVVDRGKVRRVEGGERGREAHLMREAIREVIREAIREAVRGSSEGHQRAIRGSSRRPAERPAEGHQRVIRGHQWYSRDPCPRARATC